MIRHLLSASMACWIALGLATGQPTFAQVAKSTPAGSAPSYVLKVTSAKRVHDELMFGFQAPQIVADEWVVFACRLPELAGQVDVRSSLLPGGLPVRDLGPLGRPLLMTRVPAQDAPVRDRLTVRVDFEATLLGRRLEKLEPGSPRPATVAPINPKEKRDALATSRHFDFESPTFRKWLDERKLRRDSGEGDIDFARRAFLEIKKGYGFANAEPTDRSASKTSQLGQSDSSGLVILFVSTLRANGIPSRTLFGRWAFATRPGRNANDEPHVKSEFFATGVGWVPVDIATAILLDRTSEGLVYFGEDKGDFLALHVDPDLEFDTIHFGRKSMEFLQNPSFWVLGSGSFTGLKLPVTSRIQVEPLDASGRSRRPAPKASASASKKANKAASPTAAERNPSEVAVWGLVMDKGENSLMLRADRDEQPVKYILGEHPETQLQLDWRTVFGASRVQVIYKPDSSPRELIAIVKPEPVSGTVTGEVVRNHDWWIEVKPKEGPIDGYAINGPFQTDPPKIKVEKEALITRIKALKPGDLVTIRYSTDFERHRIEGLQEREPKGK